jgi:putative FmdB family regulatory protein
MPLYEFSCNECGTMFERILAFNVANNGVSCPDCGKTDARRLLSVFAAVSKSKTGETKAVAATGPGCGCSSSFGCGCCG